MMYIMYVLHCSEQAAETGDTCSSVVDKDVISEPCCISDTVLNAGDEACHDTDAGCGDAAADDSMKVLTEDTSTQHVVAAIETELSDKLPQSGDEIQADVLEEGGEQPVEDVQPDSNKVDSKLTWYFADIKKQWRKFNIDLMPKVINSKMSLISLQEDIS